LKKARQLPPSLQIIECVKIYIVLAVPPPSTKMEALERKKRKERMERENDVGKSASLLVEGSGEAGGSAISTFLNLFYYNIRLIRYEDMI